MPDRSSRRLQFPKDRLAPTGFRGLITRDLGNISLIRGIPVLLGLPLLRSGESRKHVSSSFFGINLAPGRTPELDEFILAKVRDLGITHVRLDFPERENAPHRRFLGRLNRQGLPVLLHLVQDPRSASRMRLEKEQQQWVDFVQGIVREEPDLSEVELGSAANRYRFSGYSLRTLLLAIERAGPVLQDAGIPWNAPGLSDFEPLFLSAALSLLKQRGLLPSAVSCNLHVDRAGGPEVSDPHIAGEMVGRLLGYDLTSKMDSLSRVARAYRVGKIYCSFFSWTLLQNGVSHRRYVTEEQQANYLCRYLVMAAAGSFDRVFLGPLVSHSRGLVDGAPWHRNFPPAVVLSPPLQGDSESFRERPAYDVSKWLARLLPGKRIVGRLPTPPRTHAFAFESDEAKLWVGLWTQDGAQSVLNPKSVQQSARRVLACDLSGRPLPAIPDVISESPVFLRLEALKGALDTTLWFQVERSGNSQGGSVRSDPMEIPVRSRRRYRRFENGRYKGVLADSARDYVSTFGLSQQGPGFPGLVPVRETRYCRIFRPTLDGLAEVVQIKEFQPVRFGWARQSPAFRAWSNLLTARKRNLSVPLPLAFLESSQSPGRRLSYLFTVFHKDATSLRNLDESARNLELTYRRVGTTIREWHEAGAFHRDLSIGNLLVRKGESKVLVVDLDRALFFRRLGTLRRFRDLARVRVPEAADSEFLTGYFGGTSGSHRLLTFFRRMYRAKRSVRRRLRRLIQIDRTALFG